MLVFLYLPYFKNKVFNISKNKVYNIYEKILESFILLHLLH